MKVAPALIIELKTDRGQILSQKALKPHAPDACATFRNEKSKTAAKLPSILLFSLFFLILLSVFLPDTLSNQSA